MGAAGDNRARYYDPSPGRFISEDPIGLAGEVNLYAYTGNDPINSRDPSGLCTQMYLVKDHFFNDGSVEREFLATYWVGTDCVKKEGSPGVNEEAPPKNSVVEKVCKAIPTGRTAGVSGGVGGLLSTVGGAEMVLNYNSGVSTLFVYGGGQAGWNGGMSGSVYVGPVYGLNDSNSNYAGGFTSANLALGAGIWAASSSGGLTGTTAGLRPDGKVVAGGRSIGASLLDGLTLGIAVTNYSKPRQLARFAGFTPVDMLLYAARQVMCK